MKRILFLYKAYPFAIASYFRHVLEKNPDVELVTCGEWFGDWIPWNNGMTIQKKYVKPVDVELPRGMQTPTTNIISKKLSEKGISAEFDAIINVDAGFHLANKPDVPYIVIATDPHVLNQWYDGVRSKADYFFNMQQFYMRDGDILLPYCCSRDHHYAMSNVEKVYDASLVGLHYGQRDQLVNALIRAGIKVYYDIGAVWDEYRFLNNSAKIGLNWSSLKDINARTFEMMAMKQIPVINRLPYLDNLGLFENEHYLGFNTVEEGVDKVMWALSHEEEANAIALSAYNLVHSKHTYELRMKQVFETIGL